MARSAGIKSFPLRGEWHAVPREVVSRYYASQEQSEPRSCGNQNVAIFDDFCRRGLCSYLLYGLRRIQHKARKYRRFGGIRTILGWHRAESLLTLRRKYKHKKLNREKVAAQPTKEWRKLTKNKHK